MDKSIDITVKQLHKQEFKNLQASKLVLEFKGKTINASLINALRRLSFDYVPTYAFHEKTITIDKNTSVYSNDYMRLRLSQMTVPNIPINITYMDEKYWKGVDYADPEREKHPNDKTLIELYVNVTNTSNDILHVTTEHSKLFIDGVEVKDRFDQKYPMLIISLKPNQKFSCRCVGALGIGKINNIWSASANCYYDEIDDKLYKFTMESQGQLDEYDILYKSCDIVKEKLENIKKIVKEKYMTPDIEDLKVLRVILENEDHTIGNLINEYLQENANIVYSGLSKPEPLTDNIHIKFQSIKKNPMIPFLETIDYIANIFLELEKQFKKLGAVKGK